MRTAHLRTSSIGRRVWIVIGAVALGAAIVALVSSSASSAPSVAPNGIVCTDGPAFALKTAKGQVTTPDGNGVFMWGYATDAGSFQMPGPTLCVNEGDAVSITLTNTAITTEPVSIVFPGQTGVGASGGCAGLVTREASSGCGMVTYTFTAGEPGTYLYRSGTDPQKQVQMGLYGALIVRPALGAGYAYNDPQTAFSHEYLILLNEIDPDLHRAVELGHAYNITSRHPEYWHVNGRSFPDTIADNGAPYLPNQPYGALVQVEPFDADDNPLPILIRYANAGMDNHPFHPHGNHLRVIARDGRLLRGPAGEDTSFEGFSRTIGSGQAYDLLFRWDDVDPWISGDDPVPVTIPNLQNLVFKDDTTFYSGDPRLGEQGELPVGVTSYNECGEFYFPWHSHALNEFTNFDEGFGGLATLLRVEPPGGCP